MENKVYTIIDVETDKFSDRILEIAAIKIDENLNILEEVEIRTDIEWPKDHISGIVIPIGKYTTQEAKEILKNFCEGTTVTIGFNIPFEVRALKMHFSRTFDVMEYMREKYSLKKWNMDTCVEILKIQPIERHRALGDCHTILQIMRHMLPIKV